jgi:hypothetical protein
VTWALAWIPVLLGAHQFIEGLVWLWLQHHLPRGIGEVCGWAAVSSAAITLHCRLAGIGLTGRFISRLCPCVSESTVQLVY